MEKISRPLLIATAFILSGIWGNFAFAEPPVVIPNLAPLSDVDFFNMDQDVCAVADKSEPKTEAVAPCIDCLVSSAKPSFEKIHAKALVKKLSELRIRDRDLEFFKFALQSPDNFPSASVKAITELYKKSLNNILKIFPMGESFVNLQKFLALHEKTESKDSVSATDKEDFAKATSELRRDLEKRLNYSKNLIESTDETNGKDYAKLVVPFYEQSVKYLTELERRQSLGDPSVPDDVALVIKEKLPALVKAVEGFIPNQVTYEKTTASLEALQKAYEAKELEVKARPVDESLPANQKLFKQFEKVAEVHAAAVKTSNTCGLSFAEIFALTSYAGSGYAPLNAALRSSGPDREKYFIYRDILNEALAKLKPFKGIVIRGASLPDSVRESHVPGAIITYDAFTSTSLVTGFPGDDSFMIQSKTGRYIAPFSGSPDEREVLFKSGTKFKILGVKTDVFGKHIYVMEEQ